MAINASIKDGKVVLEIDVSGVDLQEGPARLDTVDRELASTGGFMHVGNGLRVSLKVMGRCRK
ncbi:hypothetical protein ACFQZO_24395 [Bradyrhizobium sp. GCM10027634]|uniref:hypothetical protein n=1 Tax=unclassified Bradyrhizobium TaxID=2631580 RepID=UPI00263BA668|nr:hypothetical protein [Bradyrhizobium sp. WYCCWR 12677]MDN5003982.1 hypothetical protein [Bradyrhizobium sp. WYCCWR 12677]